MDSTQKMNEILKKKRPVPRKFNTFKDFDASLFKGPGSIHNVPDLSSYINKFSHAKTPERTRANPSLNYSHIPEIRPLGKENRSSSVSRKEERSASVKRNMRDRSHNYSLLNDKSLAVDMQEVEHKRAELAGRLQVYLSSDRKSSSHKRNLSSKRSGNVAPTGQYKRLNSSFVETRQRALSQDKRPVHFHKNSSLLNNSMMFDEPGNISRDQSYLKELLDEDTSHVHDLSGVNYQYAASPNKNDETYDDHQATVSITNQDKNHAYDESIEFNRKQGDRNTPLYDKGKQLFREKKYEEGIKYLKESLETEERTTEALYLLGVSYLWLGQYANAIKEFKALLEIQPACHKNVYVLLSIAYKKSNDLPSAIKTLTKAIMKHPKYYDAYIFKGKLLLKEKQWERALADFAVATKLKPHKNLALIGQGDAFRMLYEYDKAIDCYTQAIERSPSALSTALLKRAIVLIEIKKLDEALKDLEKTIKMDPTHSEAYYFKGFVLEKKRDFNEAILCFEQAIKHKSSRKAVMKSLYEIARIKIEQRNFYEAYHTLQRATLLELEEKAFSKLKLFTEGVIHLMKRKFEEGVTNLTDVIKKQEVGDHFLPMAFNYRAYGYFCCGKTKEALEDYKELQKLTKLDQGSTYNKLLCEAILAAEADNADLASKKFAQAQKIFPNKMEPHFYRAVLTINTFYKAHPKPEAEEFNTGIDSAIQDFEKCLELNDNCSNLFYVRALVFYALGKFSLAHQNIEKAIEKADENYAKYYHLRGAIFACTQSYYNAVSDLSIAINLDKDFQPAYLERAKCYFTIGDLKQAFMDIQDYITVKSDDANIHLWAGNLLFCTGAYEDAVKAYSNSETIKDSENLLALRVKCNIVLKELNLALADLDRLLELKTANNIFYYVDRECLVALKAGTASLEEALEKESLTKAIQKITKVLSYKVSGNIFGLHDLYFYRSVFHFYLGDVQAALDDLEKSWEVRETPVTKTDKDKEQRAGTEAETKEMMKLLEDVYSSTGSDEIKEENIKPGAIDFKEYLYNKAILLIMLKRFEDGLDVILQLRTLVPPEIALEFDIFVKLINEQLQAPEEEVAPVSAKDEEPQEIIIFQYVNRLCSIFPSIDLPFNSKTQYTTRLTFCLPPVEPPSLIPTANYDILSEIKVTTVENKPEAPWIRRTFGGVIFTENYMEKEEREIDDLQEIIQRNGLKEEEIYKSLANSHRTGGTHESNSALNQAVIMEQEASNKRNNPVYIAEDIFPGGNAGKGKNYSMKKYEEIIGRMVKSRTGGV